MSRQRKTIQHSRPDLGAFLARHGLALNAQQMAAAARVDGPTLLLAVPGQRICQIGIVGFLETPARCRSSRRFTVLR